MKKIYSVVREIRSCGINFGDNFYEREEELQDGTVIGEFDNLEDAKSLLATLTSFIEWDSQHKKENE